MCCAVLFYDVLWYSMLCCATLCCAVIAVLYIVCILRYCMLYCAILCCVVLCCDFPCCTVRSCVVLCCAGYSDMLCRAVYCLHVVPCFSWLFCAVLRYSMSCCDIVCCVVCMLWCAGYCAVLCWVLCRAVLCWVLWSWCLMLFSNIENVCFRELDPLFLGEHIFLYCMKHCQLTFFNNCLCAVLCAVYCAASCCVCCAGYLHCRTSVFTVGPRQWRRPHSLRDHYGESSYPLVGSDPCCTVVLVGSCAVLCAVTWVSWHTHTHVTCYMHPCYMYIHAHKV